MRRLERRRDELNGEAEKIEELVEYLDTKKFETIEYTFRKISKHFETVFAKLVPQGHASLEMKEFDNIGETTSKVERLEGKIYFYLIIVWLIDKKSILSLLKIFCLLIF